MVKESHTRYLHQANWTQELREYIFGKIGLNKASRVLEVGCGTGAILSQINFPVVGLDLNLSALKEAWVHLQTNLPSPTEKLGFFSENKAPLQIFRQNPKKKSHQQKKNRVSPPLTCGDALSLPYANSSFDVLFSHFLLLWLPNPQKAIEEMKRVTVAKGDIIFFAEPDYSQRVDKPAELAQLGKWQADALKARGANPYIGADLAEICYETGIKIIETGTLQKSTREASAEERANEWDTLQTDLRGRVPNSTIRKMKKIDAEAWARGERILDIPTYYLWGKNQV